MCSHISSRQSYGVQFWSEYAKAKDYSAARTEETHFIEGVTAYTSYVKRVGATYLDFIREILRTRKSIETPEKEQADSINSR